MRIRVAESASESIGCGIKKGIAEARGGVTRNPKGGF